MARREVLTGFIIVTGALLVIALVYRPRENATAVLTREPSPSAERISSTVSPVPTSVPAPAETFEQRLIAIGQGSASGEEIAKLLKILYAEDPQRLFDALMAIGNSSLEVRRAVLPKLADALTFWPEAEGRYVFPVADAYGEIDLPNAAEWAAGYLVKTQRDDLAASTLLARLAETSEARALNLINNLPNAARLGALQSLAYHLHIDDLDHLYGVCVSLNSGGDASFSRVLFQRLGTERLDETAAWLATTPEAQALPGAVGAIAQAMVKSGDPTKAIVWADTLSDEMARAQAICSVYQQWAQSSPEHAIQDILSAYDGAPVLMADVFQGAAAHHGSGPAEFWETARSLQNASARAYAVSALITPMLVTLGPTETQAKIATLTPGSLERNAAEFTLQNGLKNPAIARELDQRQHAGASAN